MAVGHSPGRVVPPVLSPVSWGGLSRAFLDGVRRHRGARGDLAETLSRLFRAKEAILTDSGTSALVLALRLAAPNHGVVAVPSYACADLVSAAVRAEVRLRLYDTDPRTLSPDSDSVKGVLGRGIDAIVLVHLFGFPADTRLVATLASEAGVTVIEDAAQGAGGTLGGELLGTAGPLSLLSFGRGKGINGGGGGALMVRDARLSESLEEIIPSPFDGTRWRGLGASLAQRILGHPTLYGIPASLPFLRLGEMIIRPAGEPEGIGIGNARLANDALRRLGVEALQRRGVAGTLSGLPGLMKPNQRPCSPIPGGEPGFLRLPVVMPHKAPAPALGILRGYPITLGEVPGAAALLLPGEAPGPGATLLSTSLLTLPTHQYLTEPDVARIAAWAEAP